MAVLMRHKNNVFGLVSDLNTLQTNINNEKLRAEGVEGSLPSLNTTAKTNLVDAVNEVLSNLNTVNNTLTSDLSAEVTRATAAEGTLTTNLAQEVTDRTNADNALDSRLDVIEAGLIAGVFWKASFDLMTDLEAALTGNEATVEAGWAYYVKETNDGYVVVSENDGDYIPATWTTKSLIKFADYTEVSGLVATERERALAAEGVIATNLSNEVSRATSAEATKLTITSNLSDLGNVSTARTNLDVYSKAETDNAIRLGGSIFVTETLTVTADKIVTSQSPKNGVVFNFATVRHVDTNFVSYDIPVIIDGTDPIGKTFTLAPDASGQFDGKSVIIQYAYIPAA